MLGSTGQGERSECPAPTLRTHGAHPSKFLLMMSHATRLLSAAKSISSHSDGELLLWKCLHHLIRGLRRIFIGWAKAFKVLPACLPVSLLLLLEDAMTLYYNISVSISCMLSKTCRQTDRQMYAWSTVVPEPMFRSFIIKLIFQYSNCPFSTGRCEWIWSCQHCQSWVGR